MSIIKQRLFYTSNIFFFLKKYHKSTKFSLVRKIKTERENKIACEKKRAHAYAIKARKHKKRKRKRNMLEKEMPEHIKTDIVKNK